MIRRFFLIFVAAMIMTVTGCSTHKGLVFADREWHISEYYGQIIDSDTTWRMTFGNVLIPEDLTVISCADSMARYPGMERFISDILHTIGLDSAEILFYAPHMQTMFVIPKGTTPAGRPSSVSSNLTDERPYTMWTYEEYPEDWKRTPGEMHTYTYLNKGKKQILIVDFYDYGDTPIAQIHIFQTENKRIRKMCMPQQFYRAFFRHDVTELDRDIEFWAHIVDGHRKLAIANHNIGLEQKSMNKRPGLRY